ncbi:MAG: peptidoglycan-binding protein [bacterium]|nr:peptidoglycan-binding protein [bacterium]
MELKLNRVLARGATGDDVKQLQEFLSTFPDIYPEGKVTGYFGPATEAAIKRFQGKQGVETIGIVGPKTLSKINELLSTGAGASGVVPPGLLTAPGIQAKIATTTASSTPSGTIPAQPVGLTGTTTVPAIPAQPATTTKQGCVAAGLYWYTVSCHPKPAPPESCAASNNYCSAGAECAANGWYSCRGSCYGSAEACLGQTYVPPAVPVAPPPPPPPPPPVATSTTNRDLTAPIISNIQTSNIAQTTAIVSWSTNEVSTSDVYYSKNSSILTSGTLKGNITGNSTSHNITLSGLSAYSMYYYFVVSKDETENVATSSVNNFQTLAEPVVTSTTKTITATAGTGGTISPDGSVVVNQGANKTFIITANAGYTISTTTVDGVSQGVISTYTFTNVQTTHTISATFTQITYPITVSQGANGTISPGTTSVVSGGGQVFTIAPANGYQIASVTVDGVNQGVVSTYTFTNVTSVHSITATFSLIPITQYSITVTQGANGTITPGTTSVTSGSSQTFTITPASGYQISNLIIDGSNVASSGTYTFTNITSAHTISFITQVVPPVCAEPYTFVKTLATLGSGDGQVNIPRGIAVDAQGYVYVADTANHRIQKFDSNGTFLTKWGTQGLLPNSLDGQFYGPVDVAVDVQGSVYVVDNANNRIQKFNSNGTFLAKWGSQGNGNSQFSSPSGIGLDSSGNVYVADYGNNRIQKFDSNGTFISKWGTQGSGNGQFDGPMDIAVDAQGNSYVADYTFNNRIEKFDSNGNFLLQWGGVSAPSGVALDSSGNVFVAEMNNNYRISKFSSSGVSLGHWNNSSGSGGQLSGPWRVAVDAQGNVYVAEIFPAHRIVKFASCPSSSTSLNPRTSNLAAVSYTLDSLKVMLEKLLQLLQ